MELVPLPSAVDHHNRMETDILEALQTQSAGHLGVEAAAAKLPVTFFDRAIADDIVGRDGRTIRIAAGRAAVASRAIGDHLAAPETRMGQRVVQWRGMGTHQAGEHFALDLARQIWTRPARRQKKLWQPRKVMLGQSPRLSRPALVGTTQSTRPRIMTGIYQWRQVKSVPRLVLPEENSVSRVWRLDAVGRVWDRALTPQRRNRARLQVIAKTC